MILLVYFCHNFVSFESSRVNVRDCNRLMNDNFEHLSIWWKLWRFLLLEMFTNCFYHHLNRNVMKIRDNSSHSSTFVLKWIDCLLLTQKILLTKTHWSWFFRSENAYRINLLQYCQLKLEISQKAEKRSISDQFDRILSSE